MYLTLSWISFVLNHCLRYIEILSYKFTTMICSDLTFRVHYGVCRPCQLRLPSLGSTRGHNVDEDHVQFFRGFDQPLLSLFTSERSFDI